MTQLIDTHCHLENIENTEQAILQAEKADVTAIVGMGCDHDSNVRILELSGKYENTRVYPALGIHPWYLKETDIDSTLIFIEANIDKAVAIGEIGLDYWLREAKKDGNTRDLQKDVFKRLLDLCRQYNKPVVIHSRGSWEDCLSLTVEAGIKRAVFHWFSGPLEVLRGILENGYYVSATPSASYSKHHRQVIENSPLDRIMLETDSPIDFNGKRLGPADVVLSLEAVAEIKGISKEEVAEVTTANAFSFYGLELG
ncbi:TatD family hydrolase [Desulfobacterales bacterium HSG17]|nr:TatD family hydrolase [Desulfobacterales bacterium HSG17]